jgi:hypothetical protein
MKRLFCLVLILVLLVSVISMFSGCTTQKPNRVHIYGDVILGNEYVRGYACISITDYDADTNRVMIRGLEQYGWITLFNYTFYTANESCPQCGHQTVTITY